MVLNRIEISPLNKNPPHVLDFSLITVLITIVLWVFFFKFFFLREVILGRRFFEFY